MVTNVEILTVESPAVVYFQDGSHIVVNPYTSHGFQLVDNGFCSISETADPPPPADLVRRFLENWKALWDLAFGGPKATPY